MDTQEVPGADRKGFTAHCPRCRREQLFTRTQLSIAPHLILSILTAGLWTIVWACLLAGKALRPWRCSVCGWHKPEFRSAPAVPPHTPKKVQPPTVE